MEDKKTEGIRVVTRKEHLVILRNSIMSKYIKDELNSAIWAGELASMKEDEGEVRKNIQKSFDKAQRMMIKRQVVIKWLDEEIAKEENLERKDMPF